MTIKEILTKYTNLPQKFLVRFALYCANDVKHLIKDETSLKAFESIELWLLDKMDKEYLHKLASDIRYVIKSLDMPNHLYGSYAANYVIQDTVSAATDDDYFYYYITNVPHNASKALGLYSQDKYRDKLLEMIDELDDMEKLIYLN